MNERLLQIQNILAADPNAGSKSAADDGPKLALVIRDILWALTRADRAFPKQITYQTFAFQAFDDEWHLARRRSAVPADFTRFGVRVRHAVMASAVAIADGGKLLLGYCIPRTPSNNELAFLYSILTEPDREEMVRRSKRWPERYQTPLSDHKPHPSG